MDDSGTGRMTVAEIETRSPRPAATRPASRSPWPPWIETILADWRRRWPVVFSRPVPLAVGTSRHIKEALRAEGKAIDRKAIGVALHRWTTQGAYLRAIVRGEIRRNLDGSEAGVPDDAARQYAQTLLDERAARQAERERQQQEQLSD
jgi:sRNA-binding protein